MRIPLYQVDAFTDRPFAGNPAAICPLESWLDEAVMQAIAAENNLAETAFLAREGAGWRLRWFTPTVEVDLCGHATLASAHVIFECLEPGRTAPVGFETRSGRLTVEKDGTMLWMDLPALPAVACDTPADLSAGLGIDVPETFVSTNYMAVLADAAAVRALKPDMAVLARLAPRGAIATAPGDGEGCDFVSRYFAPAHGVPEDPVTGSAHCTLAPFWAARLGKGVLGARQISRRGGALVCEPKGDRVRIGGSAVLVLEGAIRF